MVDRVRIHDEEHRAKGNVLVRAKQYHAYEYGDELKIEGRLETPPVLEDLSYGDYLAR